MSKIIQAIVAGKELFFIGIATINKSLPVKLTIFSLLAAINSDSQTVTMTVKNEPLVKVFAEIQKQTGYGFVYQSELLQNADSIDLEVKQVSLKDALDLCFKDQPFTYTIVHHTIIINKKDGKENVSDVPLNAVSISLLLYTGVKNITIYLLQYDCKNENKNPRSNNWTGRII